MGVRNALRKPPRSTNQRAKSSTRSNTARNGKRKTDADSSDEHEESALNGPDDDDNDIYQEEGQHESEDDASLDSDALDEEPARKGGQKRKAAPRPVTKNGKASPKKSSPRKRRKKADDSDEDDDDLELQEGQEIVGVVVKAPKTGRVPPGQISGNTLDFLSQLKNPECNDREWFKLHEPVYRVAEKEWKDFIEAFTDLLVEADPQIPPLPPKDVTHRIYRDVRFSNDKTPYKTALSASFSRSGRKGIFAHYHMYAVRPDGGSLIAAGAWQPGKNELATIRNNIQRSSARLRKIISAPDFVKYFGAAQPHPKGLRQNIFGHEDELKTAPKGVDKTHKDIDLLKCRSIAVVHYFSDEDVLSPCWKDELCEIVKIARPFVHCLNDMMTLQNADDSDEDDSDPENSAAEGSGANED
ncbi:hypothetical protein CERSUDRAFT_83800 [Gelatoporia subvermispora B]|uniref:DUF2461 domain-containing protein n=1 Tax=Ceriporiopsis subvermispora (strain B) TaxID=914234 RepID=M2RE93_CERS8|nr:hypothetical protein CERSUDRAFT_83800 [Gelatoporia subvermispora B]